MRLLAIRPPARRAGVAGLSSALALGLGAMLALFCACSDEPGGPGSGTPRAQPPAGLPDDYPTYGDNADSTGRPPGGEPGQPGDPGNPTEPSEQGPMWVRFRAFNDPARPDLGLWILREGRAAAMSLAAGPPAHHVWLPADTMRMVSGWFDEAGFRELAEDSYFGEGEPGRICEIFLSDSSDAAYRVVGEEALLSGPIRRLAWNLEELAVRISRSAPDTPIEPPVDSTWVPPPDSTWIPPDSTWVPPDSGWVPPPIPWPMLRGDLQVSPSSAPEGTPRTIRLAVVNDSPDTVVMHFATTQLYDLILTDAAVEPPWPPPCEDTTWVPPNPPPDGPSGPGGPRPSSSLGRPFQHGDPDDPPPPDTTWVPPPDSTWIPPDSTWIPPDSTWTPPAPRLIWNWAHDRAFLQVPTTIILPPGAALTYQENWDGMSNEGEPVKAGAYLLLGPFLADVPVMDSGARIEVTSP